MLISLIAAIADNGVIGKDNALPWRLPDEMRHFRRVTEGKAVIMGRRTWESLRKPLKDRLNLVVTSQPDWRAPGAMRAPSLDEAIALAEATGRPEAVIIGGERLYREALAEVDRMYLTHVEAEVDGDVYFPAVEFGDWAMADEEVHEADERHAYPFRMVTYVRRGAASAA